MSDFPVPMSVEIRSSDFIPAFHAGTIREKMEVTFSEYHKRKESSLQPTTPFRPKHNRRDIGLFSTRGQYVIDHGSYTNMPKRKYSEISTTVFPTEEIDAGDKSLLDNGMCSATPKRPKLETEQLSVDTPSSSTVSRFLATITNKTLGVLGTPTIEKKNGTKIPDVDVTPRQLENGVDSLAATPKHSILKTRRPSSVNEEPSIEPFAVQKGVTSFSDLFQMATSDPENASASIRSEDESWLITAGNQTLSHSNSRSRETTPGKSLRFNVPKRLPPKMLELHEEMEKEGIVDLDQNSENSSAIEILSDVDKTEEQNDQLVQNVSDAEQVDVDNDDKETLFSCHKEPSLSTEVKNSGLHVEQDLDVQAMHYNYVEDETKIGIDEELDENHDHRADILANMSVFETATNKSLNDTATAREIKEMAKTDLARWDSTTHIDAPSEDPNNLEDDTNKNKTFKVADMSIYNPVVSSETDTPMSMTIIREMAQEAYTKPNETTQVEEKVDSLDTTTKVPDISIYIDAVRRASPDPEVTLNIPNTSIKELAKVALRKEEAKSKSPKETDQRSIEHTLEYSMKKRDLPPTINLDLSAYNSSKTEQDTAKANIDFVKTLATKQLEYANSDLAATARVPSFDFSLPYEASPAAAAKRRHCSKTDTDVSASIPTFTFSNPICTLNEGSANDATEGHSSLSINILADVKKYKKSPQKQRTNETCDHSNTSKDKLQTESQYSGSPDVNLVDRSRGKQSGNLSTTTDYVIPKFLFSPPLHSVAHAHNITEDSTLFHGWNRDESPPKNRRGRPQFDFTPAESVLPLEVRPILDPNTKGDNRMSEALIYISSEDAIKEAKGASNVSSPHQSKHESELGKHAEKKEKDDNIDQPLDDEKVVTLESQDKSIEGQNLVANTSPHSVIKTRESKNKHSAKPPPLPKAIKYAGLYMYFLYDMKYRRKASYSMSPFID